MLNRSAEEYRLHLREHVLSTRPELFPGQLGDRMGRQDDRICWSAHICAIDLAVTSNMSVQIVTEGMPAFSAWIPSCTLHALHDPQLPMATTT